MHYAFLSSIVIAALLGAAAVSVVHAEEAPESGSTSQISDTERGTEIALPPLEARPVEISIRPAEQLNRPRRESYYGQGFESRGISVENLPPGTRGYGYERSE